MNVALNHEQIESLVAVLDDSPGVTELQVEYGGLRLRVRRRETVAVTVTPAVDADAVALAAKKESSSSPTVVSAGVVGIFHALRGKPVANGDRVSAGQVVAHIETMRLMNDCIVEVGGKITDVLVVDGQPVEYGQPLFVIEPLDSDTPPAAP